MADQNKNTSEIEALRAELAQLKSLLHGMAGVPDKTKSGGQSDFIDWGSKRHAALLGIEQVPDEKDLLPGDISFRSPKSDKLYKLSDPVTPFMHFAQPTEIARLVLRQKVSSFESGRPQVPADAPPLMTFGQLLPGMRLEGEGQTT